MSHALSKKSKLLKKLSYCNWRFRQKRKYWWKPQSRKALILIIISVETCFIKESSLLLLVAMELLCILFKISWLRTLIWEKIPTSSFAFYLLVQAMTHLRYLDGDHSHNSNGSHAFRLSLNKLLMQYQKISISGK